MSDRTEWITTATLVRWAWGHLLTRRGGMVLLVTWVVVGACWGAVWGKGFAGYASGFLAFPFLAFFFLISSVVICSFAEFFTDTILGKRLSTKVASHQVIYFLLSSVFTVIGFFILLSAGIATVPFIP